MSKRSEMFSFRMPEAVRDDLSELARLLDMKRSAVVNALITKAAASHLGRRRRGSVRVDRPTER